MPIPQENLLFVERASCPFLTRMTQHLRSIAPSLYLSPKSISALSAYGAPYIDRIGRFSIIKKG
ncbi:hypothetical protein QUB70_29175 [Microcoleus sp. A003_D6]|uniref:hypothetical protein n=1 Tax=Microcoleus sp. A003_D6 TaxID=3055266 RepID=UPI002FD70850